MSIVKGPNLFERLFALLQYCYPHHPLSRVMQFITRLRVVWLKNLAIKNFIRHFKVDMSQAVDPDYTVFPSFNAFFTRALKPECRPIVSGANEIACPVDAHVSQMGKIEAGQLYQAKGHTYSLTTLLGAEDTWSEKFYGGEFATLYLSPRDYHRIHMPLNAELREMRHVPGRLFSVNRATVKTVPQLFARNERVVCLFETEHGPMAMILVGAIFVGNIETVWQGVITPPSRTSIQSWHYPREDKAVKLNKGDEMGRFNMGSTVIMLFGPQQMQWADNLQAESPTQMGQLLGNLTKR